MISSTAVGYLGNLFLLSIMAGVWGLPFVQGFENPSPWYQAPLAGAIGAAKLTLGVVQGWIMGLKSMLGIAPLPPGVELEMMGPLGIFDLILCRNIAIYFSQDFKTELFKKIADCLNIKGTLILGATETLYGQSKDFEAIPDKKCFYYRLQKGEK